MDNLTGKTAMIVDDTSFMRLMLKSLLDKKGCKVVSELGDGTSVVEQYQKLKPDFVTMDVIMPNMDGITALKALIAVEPDAKVIMVTSLGQESKVLEAKEAGACSFIIKPFDPEDVIDKIIASLS